MDGNLFDSLFDAAKWIAIGVLALAGGLGYSVYRLHQVERSNAELQQAVEQKLRTSRVTDVHVYYSTKAGVFEVPCTVQMQSATTATVPIRVRLAFRLLASAPIVPADPAARVAPPGSRGGHGDVRGLPGLRARAGLRLAAHARAAPGAADVSAASS
jgi:hypothetical protein